MEDGANTSFMRRSNFDTPLHEAALGGHTGCVVALLARVKELGLLAKGTEPIIDLTYAMDRENEGRGDERDVEVAVSVTPMEQ